MLDVKSGTVLIISSGRVLVFNCSLNATHLLSPTVFLQDGKDMTITSIIAKIKITSIRFYNNTVMKITKRLEA